MLNDRRKFMISTGMAAGAVMAGQLGASPKFASSGSAESDVAKLISRYGALGQVSRDAKGLVRIQVKISDHGRLATMYTEQQKLPFGQILVTADNTMEFTHRGERFALSHQIA